MRGSCAPRHRGLGYTRQYTIYDQADARRLVKKCLDDLGVDVKRFTPATVHNQISDAKNKLRDAEAYRQLVGDYFEQTIADVYEAYERELMRMNAMDFDDLLVRVVNVLELFPEVRARYAASFRHVLVDEYQDTNPVQYRLLQLLAEEHRNLMVVGDDAQSIYSFRGADIGNILNFEDDFPDATTIKLEQNYRSTQTILDAANAVIAHNRAQKQKSLWSDAGAGDPIQIRELDDEMAEARFVVGEVDRLIDEGHSLDEIAVFYRTNAQSRVLEDTLVRREVNYQVIGGPEVLRARRDQGRDRLPDLDRQPAGRHLVHADVQRAASGHRADVAVAGHRARRDDGDLDLGGGVGPRDRPPDSAPPPSARSSASWPRWPACASAPRPACPSATCSRRCSTSRRTSRRWRPSGRSRHRGAWRTSSSSSSVPASFDARAVQGEDTLETFLAQVALTADADGREDGAGRLTLMTLHNAKGLEYPIVFMLGLEEGVFPHSRALEEGGPRGGAASLPTSGSPAPSATCT